MHILKRVAFIAGILGLMGFTVNPKTANVTYTQGPDNNTPVYNLDTSGNVVNSGVTTSYLGFNSPNLPTNQGLCTDGVSQIVNSGLACGVGGVGASSLAISAGVSRSSPTSDAIFPSSEFVGSVSGSSMTVTLNASSVTLQGQNGIILNQNTLQSGATFYVSSGTVQGPLSITNLTQTAGNFALTNPTTGGTGSAALQWYSGGFAINAISGAGLISTINRGPDFGFTVPYVANGTAGHDVLDLAQLNGAGFIIIPSSDNTDGGVLGFQTPGSATHYEGFRSPVYNASISNNPIWNLPLQDASGLWQSDGSGNLSISTQVVNSLGLGVTYGVTAGSVNVNGVNYSWPSTSGSGGQFLSTNGGTPGILTWATSVGGGGSSTLAVTSGSLSGFTGALVSSPTAIIVVDSNTFSSTLTGTATNFIAIPGLPSQLVLTSSGTTALYIGTYCTTARPCNIAFGNTVYSLTGTATASVASGSGTVYIYMTAAGTLTVGYPVAMSVSCSGGCTATSGITSFPSQSVPIYTWATASAGNWATSGTDERSAYSRDAVTAGTGLLSTQTTANALSVDNTVVAELSGGQVFVGSDTFAGTINFSSGVVLNGQAGTSGQVFTSQGAGSTPTWTTVSGSGGGGGYNVAPATVTFLLNQGVTASTMTTAAATWLSTGAYTGSQATNYTVIGATTPLNSEVLTVAGGIDVSTNDVSGNISNFIFPPIAGSFANNAVFHFPNAGGEIGIDGQFSGTMWFQSSNNYVQGGSNYLALQAYGTGSLYLAAGKQGQFYGTSISNAALSVSAPTSQPYALAVSTVDATGTYTLDVTTTTHLNTQGVDGSTVTSCGTLPTLAGNAISGKITTGTGSPTACTLTFGHAFKNEPNCLCNTNAAVACDPTSTSNTAVTFTLGATETIIKYICIGSD